MTRFISQTKPKANKIHNCMASIWLTDGHGSLGLRGLTFTFSEWREIIKARNNNWKIQKGEKYLRQTNEYEGRLFQFKAIPSIHEICCKYDYYQE